MFTHLRLWLNILLGMGLAIVLAVALLSVANLRTLEQLILEHETRDLRQHAHAIQVGIATETRVAETLSALVAGIPAVRDAFARRDRDWLRDQLLPAYRSLEAGYGAVQFQFHTPPATSFLRLHKIEKFGDDLSAFRHSVVEANQHREPRRGLEIGVADLGARGMVPVAKGNDHLGTVEFGMSFGPSFFDTFKAEHGVEVAFHVRRPTGLETFASTHGDEPLLDPDTLLAVLDGTPHQRHARLRDGRPVAVYAEAVRDYSGAPIGVVTVAMDRAQALTTLRRATWQAVLAGGVAILFGLALALATARVLARRMRRLAADMARVASGDLSGDILLPGRDELAELGLAAERMRQHLHELVAEVERHSRGVHAASTDIVASVESQAATSSEISASVAEITATVEELSSSSTQIADYAGTVEAIARRNEEDSRLGSGAMERLAAHMAAIQRDNRRSLEEIVDLGSRSRDIASIMSIIDTLANQTRLIAFNAALEASSAGEAGKRFGVVANEIRRLADSVSSSTGEIAARVGDIQAVIQRLTAASEQEAATIEEGLTESAQAASLLRTLVQAAGQSSTAARQINLSTQQQKTASSQVALALREIVTASADTASSVRRIAGLARDMNALAASLREQVTRFRLATPTPDSLSPS